MSSLNILTIILTAITIIFLVIEQIQYRKYMDKIDIRPFEEKLNNTPLVILTGESGSGKSTIERSLEKVGFVRIVSYTTRKPRVGEIKGVSYHYISKLLFLIMHLFGFFGEYTKYNGNYYGAAKKDIKKPNSVGVFEPYGLRQIQQQGYKNISFYIDVPEEEKLQRMINRGDNIDKAQERIRNDKVVFKNVREEVDYIIMNINIEDTIEKIINVVNQNGFRENKNA